MEGTEAADLMIREGIQLTEASIRLMAAGSKNLAAFLFALARDHKKLMGKTSMAHLLREGKELKVFRIRAEDMGEFKRYAKQYGVLFAGVTKSFIRSTAPETIGRWPTISRPQ